jgi:ABC-type amino acid transport system permease subunit
MKLLFLFFLTISFFSIGEIDTLNDITHEFQPNIIIENNIPLQPISDSNILDKLIPLFGVIIGFLLVISKDYFSRKRLVNNEGQGWIEVFVGLENPLKKQIEEIDFFLKNNPVDTKEFTDFLFYDSLNCDDFAEYDKKNLTPYLKKSKKLKNREAIKLSSDLKGYVRIIKSNYIKIPSFFVLLTDNTTPHFQEFTEGLIAFKKVNAAYVDEIIFSGITVDSKQVNLANKITELTKQEISPSITSGLPLNPFKLSKDFIRPLIQLSFDDRHHPKIVKLIELLSQCDHAVVAISKERKYLRKKLEKVKNSLDENLVNVTKLINKL